MSANESHHLHCIGNVRHELEVDHIRKDEPRNLNSVVDDVVHFLTRKLYDQQQGHEQLANEAEESRHVNLK